MASQTSPDTKIDWNAAGTQQPTASSKQGPDDQQQQQQQQQQQPRPSGESTMPRTDPNADSATGRPIAPTGPPTDEEKRELIARYAQLFYEHFRQFRDPLERMKFINTEILGRAKFDKRYLSVEAMHTDYDLMLSQYLVHTPELMQRVGLELNKFAEVGRYWWPKCVAHAPTQAERQAEMEAVFERVKHEDFNAPAFVVEYEEFYSADYYEGVLSIMDTWMNATAGGIITREA
ncbi:hypothetical protein AYL99_06476 [Fonsecaea erecta]|uniref:Uncharacterized protein n=1 Tax=Fonsecaea erecta TaxID=1367422 RepID=A0A178ZHC0_9EURO|nr:hypothetical protein AYL99_06476 [Fonsecaea erecta]OAP59178.1 hypothetical protein AYL99_06476 [Fonsecaea erecta]